MLTEEYTYYSEVLGWVDQFLVSAQMELLNNNVFQICVDYAHKGSGHLINSHSNQDKSCYLNTTEAQNFLRSDLLNISSDEAMGLPPGPHDQ